MTPKSSVSTISPSAVPFWRDIRVIRILSQVAFAILVAVVAGLLYSNMKRGLEARGLSGGFDFLRLEAGFQISEGITYDPSDSYARAFLVGIVNTLRVTVVGIILATILGVVMGVARLSTNWLVNKIAAVYVELIRNTPLLVQLFVWYFAIILKLPRVKESIALPGSVFISNRGMALPWLVPTASFRPWSYWLAAGAALAAGLWIVCARGEQRTGRPPFSRLWTGAAFVIPPFLGWFLTPGGSPLLLSKPALQGWNYQGGLTLTPEFTALLLGLVVYTGAFIAEVVRAGIQAVPRGQIEAARAMGLTEGQTLRLVIFPQALRVIIPPLTSQYLNLAKNSSLAIAIGFPDLFNVAGTIFNQTGQAVQVIVLIMASYLSMSLFTSLLMNLYNRRIQFVER